MNDELYHQAILELARKARGASRLEAPQASVTVDNPLCGDRVTLDLSLADGRVREVGHKVRGCLLCQAAAAAIGARAPGETPAALRAVARDLGAAIAGAPEAAPLPWPELAAFAPVHAHKSRHDCVLLPFAALTQALDQLAPEPR
jgi:NifU-like protein involved in Fe-S cluster formation